MFSYQKRLLFPVYVEHPDERFAAILLKHFEGKDSEFASFTRCMIYRLHITNPFIRDLLGMIAAEELNHMEIIGVAIKKLGIPEIPLDRFSKQTIPDMNPGSTEPVQILKRVQETEERTRKLYLRHLAMTNDTYLKKMIRFLINREEVHQRLFEKIIVLIEENAGNEQFASLIHEYKMSLRVVK
ncbi:MAG: Mn-containing catalase [Peptococcaceae bacterium]|nr:Mn-containing catalase [Peptococcaceae bacterium]